VYIKKGGCVCEVETDGKRLLLEPVSTKSFTKLGDGLYLKKEGKLYNGRGLLLGPNSPFKNVPILGMLLCMPSIGIFLHVIAPRPVMCFFMVICQCCFAIVKVLLKKLLTYLL